MSSGIVNVTSRMQNYIPDESFFIISNDLPEVILDTQTISIEDLSSGLYMKPNLGANNTPSSNKS